MVVSSANKLHRERTRLLLDREATGLAKPSIAHTTISSTTPRVQQSKGRSHRLAERRYAAKPTMICTQYTPAEWHDRLGGEVQTGDMIDRLIHSSIKIDLGDANV